MIRGLIAYGKIFMHDYGFNVMLCQSFRTGQRVVVLLAYEWSFIDIRHVISVTIDWACSRPTGLHLRYLYSVSLI